MRPLSIFRPACDALVGIALGLVFICQVPASRAQAPPVAPTAKPEPVAKPEPASKPAPAAKPEPAAKALPKRARHRARGLAHELAAAGSYLQRAALWEAELSGVEPAVIPVQLYAGNEYQFIVGFDVPDGKLGLAVFDARGRVIAGAVHRGEGKMVMRIKPAQSGIHRVRIRPLDGSAAPVATALTYIYK